jgi:psp operon transcriptional activator
VARNVRELKNVIERAVYRSQGREIDTVQFNPFENPFQPIARKEEPDLSSPGIELPLDSTRLPSATWTSRSSEGLGAGPGEPEGSAGLMGLTYDQFRGLYRKYKQLLET